MDKSLIQTAPYFFRDDRNPAYLANMFAGQSIFLLCVDVAAAMRQAFEDQSRTRAKGALAARRVGERFTWEKSCRVMAERIGELASRTSPTLRLRPPRTGPAASLTICTVTEDHEAVIAHTLAAGSTTDEIVVVDRGSGDRTLAILRESPARVYTCDPSDAPSSSWNAAFLKATRDWILALDATEFLPIQSLQRLKSQLSRSNPPDGYRLPIGDGRTGCFLGWVTRLVRNATSIRRAYLAGADLEAAIRQAGGRIEELDAKSLHRKCGRPGFKRPLSAKQALSRIFERGISSQDVRCVLESFGQDVLMELCLLVDNTSSSHFHDDQLSRKVAHVDWRLYTVDDNGNPTSPMEGLHEIVNDVADQAEQGREGEESS